MTTTVQTHQLLNTLFVLTQGAYLHVDHETIKVELEGKTHLQVPVHHLGAVVCFGNIMVSPALMYRCAEDGRSLVFLDRGGRFKARLEGPVSGNVLLRIAQHRAYDKPEEALGIAKDMAAGKLQNARQVLLRAARQQEEGVAAQELRKAAEAHASVLERLEKEKGLDTVRGREGEAALAYFSVFQHLIMEDAEIFHFSGRNRRPPRDPVNALLSFIYALLLTDCVAAAEGVGLDPQVGFLHAVRPGRPSLGLDLMEELRPIVADRLALTLINRRQIKKEHFEERPGGAVLLNDEGRRLVVVAYQQRKQEEVTHPLLERPLPRGLIPHVQARLLARKLRGDLEEYVPFVAR
jgi:CRISPR-associated protein Cas1